MNRDAQLREIRDRTARLVARLRQGDGSVADTATLIEERQELVESLSMSDGALTPSERKLVGEIATLDRYVFHWCTQSQSDIGQRLVQRRPHNQPDSSARIISQNA